MSSSSALPSRVGSFGRPLTVDEIASSADNQLPSYSTDLTQVEEIDIDMGEEDECHFAEGEEYSDSEAESVENGVQSTTTADREDVLKMPALFAMPSSSSGGGEHRSVSFRADYCELPGTVSDRLDLKKARAFFDGLTVSPRSAKSLTPPLRRKNVKDFKPWRLVTDCIFGNSSDSFGQVSSTAGGEIDSDAGRCSSLGPSTDVSNLYVPNFECGRAILFRQPKSNPVVDRRLPFFKRSRFSNVPPTVLFYLPGERVEKPPRAVRCMLRWCHNSLIPKVVRRCLAVSHFTIVDDKLFWIGYWGRHLKSNAYKQVMPYQKVNHFPGAFHIGRKDRLWTHIHKMATKWGYDHFDLMPLTYVLPRDSKRLKAAFANTTSKQLILKPPASARGTGIKVVHKLKQIPRKTPLVVQHYVDRPFLINQSKFDLRFYVYITSFNPLRIYLYQDGLVRFASVRYSNALSSLGNRFMHLTNYSINKNAGAGDDQTSVVDKWAISKLWKFLRDRNFDVDLLTERVSDLIVKSVICCESAIYSHMQQHAAFPFVCHEMFGLDILLDAELRPWLLEVNISPSLHSGTELDRSVKAPLARDVLNLAGVNVPDMRQAHTSKLSPEFEDPQMPDTLDYRTKAFDAFLTAQERHKQDRFLSSFLRDGHVDSDILTELNPSDVRYLIACEDEYDRRGGFSRIFPTPKTGRYLKYFDRQKYSNLLLDAWTVRNAHLREQGLQRLEAMCAEKVHLAKSMSSGGAKKETEPVNGCEESS